MRTTSWLKTFALSNLFSPAERGKRKYDQSSQQEAGQQLVAALVPLPVEVKEKLNIDKVFCAGVYALGIRIVEHGAEDQPLIVLTKASSAEKPQISYGRSKSNLPLGNTRT